MFIRPIKTIIYPVTLLSYWYTPNSSITGTFTGTHNVSYAFEFGFWITYCKSIREVDDDPNTSQNHNIINTFSYILILTTIHSIARLHPGAITCTLSPTILRLH